VSRLLCLGNSLRAPILPLRSLAPGRVSNLDRSAWGGGVEVRAGVRAPGVVVSIGRFKGAESLAPIGPSLLNPIASPVAGSKKAGRGRSGVVGAVAAVSD
jgi:hypothetical protein